MSTGPQKRQLFEKPCRKNRRWLNFDYYGAGSDQKRLVRLFKLIQSNQKGFHLFSLLLAAAQSGAYFGGVAADFWPAQAMNWSWHEAARSHALHNSYNLTSPFLGNGTDISAYVQAAFNLDCLLRRSNHPSAMRGDTAHAHRPFENARVHAAVAFTQDSMHACPFLTDQSALQGQTSSVIKHNG